ncbi:Uncharacterized conserved protein [Noviherbaspirillum humi]|uniref:Uncharacterized conserved protein n=1 Tax=Noviherbaspirillum humi TaxID=1688639 RepID=A0A239C7Q0_9BURK|nr:GFA family protein [Noviherbaspirillum humi]SNS16285.1 Uncharacterized conserved protein [Noviherbaspirillum humi]
MVEGSCMCGMVRYRYAGNFGVVTVCHCAHCRKAQGSSGVVAVPVDAARLEWLEGKASIAEYESSPGKMRAFCRQCGSPLYSRRVDDPGVLRLRMGSIDSPTDAVPAAHIFVADLPPWAALEDDAPRYAGFEPSRQ